MFKVSKPEMVNKIYLYDDKMTVLYNTQDSHSDVTIDDLSSSRVVLVEPRGKQSNSTASPLTKGDSSVQYSSSENQSRHVISCLSSSENHMLTTSLSSYR